MGPYHLSLIKEVESEPLEAKLREKQKALASALSIVASCERKVRKSRHQPADQDSLHTARFRASAIQTAIDQVESQKSRRLRCLRHQRYLLYHKRQASKPLPLELIAKILAMTSSAAAWACVAPVPRLALPLEPVIDPLAKLICLFEQVLGDPDGWRNHRYGLTKQTAQQRTYSCYPLKATFASRNYSIEIVCPFPHRICRLLNREPRFYRYRKTVPFRVLQDNRLVRDHPQLLNTRRVG